MTDKNRLDELKAALKAIMARCATLCPEIHCDCSFCEGLRFIAKTAKTELEREDG